MSIDRTILPIELQQVVFAPRDQVLLGPINLTLGAHARTVIMGANGSGKSLLLRLCHGLIAPTSGVIRCGEQAGDPQTACIRKRQAMVFQRPVMMRRSVRGNVLYALRLRGVRGSRAEQLTQQALALVGLEALAKRSARVLSGGEQQRLALARAWVIRPEVLFLDEPTASLDPDATTAVEAAVQRFAEQGTRIIMTTHSTSQARRIADMGIWLDQGQVTQHDPLVRRTL